MKAGGLLLDHAGRWAWIVVLAAHAVLAAYWWVLMPGGFPLWHPRFWANRVLPVVLISGAAWGLAAALGRRREALRFPTACTACFWIGAGAAAWILFPVSAGALGPLAVGVGLVLLAAVSFPWPTLERRSRRVAFLLTGAASLAGGALAVLTQQAPLPGTTPAGVSLPPFASATGRVPSTVRLGEGLTLSPAAGEVTVRVPAPGGATVSVNVEPLLTFESRSPDRCWTLFAPRELREGPARRVTGWSRAAGTFSVAYEDDGRSVLRVRGAPTGSAEIEGWSELRRPVYSHLNQWCAVTVLGHRELSLEFSPCPGVRLPFEPADYPVGRPATFASYAEGRFRLLRASTGEKGPFKTLAAGALGREDPLSVTLYDLGEPVCRIVWEDWARQAGTALSPTAGWGGAENAVELERMGENKDAPATLRLTLAATSVGRGWDSVGHGAGVYRNRMRIETGLGP